MGDRCGRCSPGWRRRRAAGCLWGTGSTTALTPQKGDAATAPLPEKLLGPCRVLHCADEGGANVVGPAGTRPSSTFGNASGCAWINRAGYSCARAVASRWCCVAAAIAATATADEPAGDCRVRRRPARLEAATSARTAAAWPMRNARGAGARAPRTHHTKRRHPGAGPPAHAQPGGRGAPPPRAGTTERDASGLPGRGRECSTARMAPRHHHRDRRARRAGLRWPRRDAARLVRPSLCAEAGPDPRFGRDLEPSSPAGWGARASRDDVGRPDLGGRGGAVGNDLALCARPRPARRSRGHRRALGRSTTGRMPGGAPSLCRCAGAGLGCADGVRAATPARPAGHAVLRGGHERLPAKAPTPVPSIQTMIYQTLQWSVNDGILTLTLNRPERLNAFTVRMADELVDAFGRASHDDGVRAIVVTGAGRAFCAGMDLAESGNVF